MDQDQFNDFESAPACQQSKEYQIEQDPSSVHTEPISVLLSPITLLSEITMQPPFSLIVNLPSHQTVEIDNQSQEPSVWPNLTKIESDHVATVEPIQFDFSKIKSEGDIAIQSNEHVNDFLQFGTGKETKTDITFGTTDNPQHLNHFHFGHMNEKNMNGLDLNLQNSEISKPEMGSLNVNESDLEAFAVLNTVTQPLPINNIESTLVSQNSVVSHHIDEPTTEVRKQSDQFVFQSQAKEQEKGENIFIGLESQPQKSVENEMISYINNGTTMEDRESHQPQAANLTQNKQLSEPKQQQKVITETQTQQVNDEDEFGDYEQIVHVIQNHIENSYSLQSQSNGCQNQVKIDQSKAPYGVNVHSKEKELQTLVEALPDYSFLLVQAFKSV